MLPYLPCYVGFLKHAHKVAPLQRQAFHNANSGTGKQKDVRS